jgi:hypothetical protein
MVGGGIAEVQAGLSCVMVRKTNGDICAAGNNWYGSFGLNGPWGCCALVNVLTCPLSAPLPIELTAFTVMHSGDKNILRWMTGSETNNDYFSIERSSDGKYFSAIGKVEGGGNTSQSKEYFFEDYSYHAGENFYRLKQVDYNGYAEYSRIILIKLETLHKNQVVIYPQPAWDFINIQLPYVNSNFMVNIYNALGETIFTGTNSNRINVSEFLSGIYFLKLTTQSNTLVEKFEVH